MAYNWFEDLKVKLLADLEAGGAGGDPSAAIAAAIAALVNAAPSTLDTLNELATALGDDPNFATTVTNALAAKAPLVSPAFTGSPTINGHAPVTADQIGTAASHPATDFDLSGAAASAQSAAATDATTKVGTEQTRALAAEGVLNTNNTTNATAISTETTRATTAEGLKLAKASNLSDLANAATARTNLGLGDSAVHAASDFDTSGAAAAAIAASNQRSSNLSDVANASTARTNLGLGSAAVLASSAVLQTANNLSEVTAATARTNLGLGTAATHPSTDFAPPVRAVTLTVSSNTYTADCSTTDVAIIASPTAGFTIANPTSTPLDGQRLIYRILSSGSIFTPTWGTAFLASGVATLPTTLVASKTITCGFRYDNTAAKWVLLAVDPVGY